MLTLNRSMRVAVTRTTTVEAPRGAELVKVDNGTGPGFALLHPERYVAGDSFGRHDIRHYYCWVPAEAVDCDGRMENGAGKRRAWCRQCGAHDFERYEGDRCPGPGGR